MNTTAKAKKKYNDENCGSEVERERGEKEKRVEIRKQS